MLLIASFFLQVGHLFHWCIAFVMHFLQKMCPHIVDVSSSIVDIQIAQVSLTSFDSSDWTSLLNCCPVFLFLEELWSASPASSQRTIGLFGGTRPCLRRGLCSADVLPVTASPSRSSKSSSFTIGMRLLRWDTELLARANDLGDDTTTSSSSSTSIGAFVPLLRLDANVASFSGSDCPSLNSKIWLRFDLNLFMTVALFGPCSTECNRPITAWHCRWGWFLSRSRDANADAVAALSPPSRVLNSAP